MIHISSYSYLLDTARNSLTSSSRYLFEVAIDTKQCSYCCLTKIHCSTAVLSCSNYAIYQNRTSVWFYLQFAVVTTSPCLCRHSWLSGRWIHCCCKVALNVTN